VTVVGLLGGSILGAREREEGHRGGSRLGGSRGAMSCFEMGFQAGVAGSHLGAYLEGCHWGECHLGECCLEGCRLEGYRSVLVGLVRHSPGLRMI
jgi:hypothetical protein